MATRGTLMSYLALCIQTLRGHWAREGDQVSRPKVLTPRRSWRAQPAAHLIGAGLGASTDPGMNACTDTHGTLPAATPVTSNDGAETTTEVGGEPAPSSTLVTM